MEGGAGCAVRLGVELLIGRDRAREQTAAGPARVLVAQVDTLLAADVHGRV